MTCWVLNWSEKLLSKLISPKRNNTQSEYELFGVMVVARMGLNMLMTVKK